VFSKKYDPELPPSTSSIFLHVYKTFEIRGYFENFVGEVAKDAVKWWAVIFMMLELRIAYYGVTLACERAIPAPKN
jgi:hypothetical protein